MCTFSCSYILWLDMWPSQRKRTIGTACCKALQMFMPHIWSSVTIFLNQIQVHHSILLFLILECIFALLFGWKVECETIKPVCPGKTRPVVWWDSRPSPDCWLWPEPLRPAPVSMVADNRTARLREAGSCCRDLSRLVSPLSSSDRFIHQKTWRHVFCYPCFVAETESGVPVPHVYHLVTPCKCHHRAWLTAKWDILVSWPRS